MAATSDREPIRAVASKTRSGRPKNGDKRRERSRSLVRLAHHEPRVNPFVNLTPTLPPYEWFKIILLGPTLVPIRLVSSIVVVVLVALVCKIATWGLTREELESRPLTRIRRVLMWPSRWLARLLLFCWGFHWVTIKGRPAAKQDAPIVVSNHVTVAEAALFFWRLLPLSVSKQDNLEVPVWGSVMRATATIGVRRLDPHSRQESIEKICARSKIIEPRLTADQWPQVLIFPEGTTTNAQSLITFKSGAFIPGVPVQPCVIRYPFKHCDLSFTPDVSMLWVILRQLSQFHNRLELEWLPVYRPSPRERRDPKLYAQNVRKVMADALGVPVSDHTYGDVLLSMAAIRHGMNEQMVSRVIVETGPLMRRFAAMSLQTLQEAFERFVEIDRDHSSSVSYDEFARAMGIPPSPRLEEVFRMLDLNESGEVDFRSFLVGMGVCSEFSDDNLLDFAFRVFGKQHPRTNEEGKQVIDLDGLRAILTTAFPDISEEQVIALFARADLNADGAISYGEFRDFLRGAPEYAALLSTFFHNAQQRRNELDAVAAARPVEGMRRSSMVEGVKNE